MNESNKSDVHAHYLPPPYRAALLEAGHDQPDGFPQVPAWSVQEHVDAMDRLGIATSLPSMSFLAPARMTSVISAPSPRGWRTARRRCSSDG